MARSRQRLRLGVEAKCSVLLSKLHPLAVVDAHIPNREAQKRLTDLIAVRIADATHSGRTLKSVFFTSPMIPNKELYCSKKFCTVLEEGPEDLLFDGEVQEPSNVEEEQAPTEIDGAVFRAGNRSEDIEFVRNQCLVVNDDNEPAPENIPQEQVTFSRLFDGQSWGYNGIDRRATSVPVDQEPSFQGGWNPAKKVSSKYSKRWCHTSTTLMSSSNKHPLLLWNNAFLL